MHILAQLLLGLWLGLTGPPAQMDDVGSHGDHSSARGYDWDNAGGYDWDSLTPPE